MKIVRTLTNVTSSLYYFVHSHSQGAYLLSYGTTALHSTSPKCLNIHNVCWLHTWNTMQSHSHNCIHILHTNAFLCCWCTDHTQLCFKMMFTKQMAYPMPAASILALCCSRIFTIAVWPCRAAAIRAVSPFCNAFPRHSSKASAKYGSHWPDTLNCVTWWKLVRTLTNVTSSLYCFLHSHSQGAYLLSDGTTALHFIYPRFLNIHNVCWLHTWNTM